MEVNLSLFTLFWKTKQNFLTCAPETLKLLEIDSLAFFPAKQRECLWVKPPLVLRLSSFLIHSFSLIMAWTSLGFSGWCLLLEEYLFENISTAKTVNLLLKMSQWTLFLLGPQIKAIFRCSEAWFASSRKFKDFFFFPQRDCT